MEHAREHVAGPLTILAGIVEGGVVAGIIGGSAMAVFLAVYTAWRGLGLLYVPRLMGAMFYGASALRPGLGAAFWGLVLHFAVSTAFGVLFAVAARPGTTPMAVVAGGIVFGLLVWLVMTFLVLPLVDPVMRNAVPHMSFGWFAAHVPYGACLAIAERIRRSPW